MRIRRLQAEQVLPCSLDELFAFFGDAHNLNRLTPPWLNFQILTPPPIAMRPGTLIDYQLRLWSIPVRWQSEITVWEPPYRFVDVQRRGPYRHWRHEHLFEDRSGATWACDQVDYAVPGGWFEPLVNRWLVGPQLEAIFAYRRQQLEATFPATAS